jgi:Fur family ferric uptake transcriptional regulator
VLSALLEADKPLTREQIAKKLEHKAPNKVTIYRTLDLLVSSDLVHKAYVQDRAWHFEPAHNCTADQCHPHFTCTSCNNTHCLTEMSLPMAKSPHNGFIIQHQKVQLEGLCPKCSNENRA